MTWFNHGTFGIDPIQQINLLFVVTFNST